MMPTESALFAWSDLIYFLAGALGTSLRVMLSTTQATWTMRLLYEAIAGGIATMAIGSTGLGDNIPLIGDDFAKLMPKGKAVVLCLSAIVGSYTWRTFEHRAERRNGHS